ncbi:MAG: hypothetical protein Q7W29_04955 [bacterium]|nr:hypothetical protein [bacterium]
MGWWQELRRRGAVDPGKLIHGAGDWLPEAETPPELRIAPLVHPLRYDIVVRMRLFEAYAADRDRFRRDPAAFVERARGHDYRVWFERVMLVRRAEFVARHAGTTESIFAETVRGAAALYESIAETGFDPKQPVVLFTGRRILPADSGAVSAERYFPGDGCHRLACLMALGCTTLPRDRYRLKRFDRLQPLDNTRLLRDHLDLDWPASVMPGA